MKRIFTILSLLLLVHTAFSQSQLWNNFYKDNVLLKIYWQQVINTDLTFDELVFEIKASGNFQDIEVFNNKVIAQIRPFEVNYMNSGYTVSVIPDFILTGNISAMVVFEYRDNKYRVTIRNIVRHYNTTVYYFYRMAVDPIEGKVMNRKNELKEETFMTVTSILNQEFQNRVILNRPYDQKW